MRVLSFDPGHQTGVAIFNAKGEWELGLTIGSNGWSTRTFQHITALARPDVVLVEDLPVYRRDSVTSGIFQDIMHWYKVAGYPVETINPGQWKGMVKRVVISGTHQMDAAAMALWYVNSRRVKIE